MSIKIGSLFAGIGGFELGCERAWPNSKTIWQVEQNPFCQSILSKHWPTAKIYNDVRDITINNVEPVDVLLGGFPCQDISTAGQQKGVHDGKKSSLWWEMHRIISEIRPRVVIMENVANIIRLGGADVVGSLAQIGYDCEWTVIRASDFGACHQRARWFCVTYPKMSNQHRKSTTESQENKKTWINSSIIGEHHIGKVSEWRNTTPDTNGTRFQRQSKHSQQLESTLINECRYSQNHGSHNGRDYWKKTSYPSPFCRVDDGLPNRVARLKALGNAIVPQCSQWIAEQVLQSGLLDDLLEGE